MRVTGFLSGFCLYYHVYIADWNYRCRWILEVKLLPIWKWSNEILQLTLSIHLNLSITMCPLLHSFVICIHFVQWLALIGAQQLFLICGINSSNVLHFKYTGNAWRIFFIYISSCSCFLGMGLANLLIKNTWVQGMNCWFPRHFKIWIELKNHHPEWGWPQKPHWLPLSKHF